MHGKSAEKAHGEDTPKLQAPQQRSPLSPDESSGGALEVTPKLAQAGVGISHVSYSIHKVPLSLLLEGRQRRRVVPV